MTTRLPAGAPRKVVDRLIGMALQTESTRKRFQQARIGRTVWAMTFHTSVAREIGNWIVFVDKWPGNLWMAGDATLFGCAEPFTLVPIGMRVMAVAADHTPFRDRMMEVMPEFVDFALVASAT